MNKCGYFTSIGCCGHVVMKIKQTYWFRSPMIRPWNIVVLCNRAGLLYLKGTDKMWIKMYHEFKIQNCIRHFQWLFKYRYILWHFRVIQSRFYFSKCSMHRETANWRVFVLQRYIYLEIMSFQNPSKNQSINIFFLFYLRMSYLFL